MVLKIYHNAGTHNIFILSSWLGKQKQVRDLCIHALIIMYIDASMCAALGTSGTSASGYQRARRAGKTVLLAKKALVEA